MSKDGNDNEMDKRDQFVTNKSAVHRHRLPVSGKFQQLQALARSTLDKLLMSVSNTFIFSTRHVRAVSVASPTFS
ncbi:hypothetical protein XENOCAPTIV_014153 [Xenoophorus captivus]|uniref:Uncharacterized protein n=1 Tax=Xenoophorus captivus TaxID=1517983 RepID=A0ABV0R531_9TELE